MADNVELVRRLWAAFERGGMEAVYEIADPDVEWQPYGGGGTVYRGHDGLRAYMEERRARREVADARLYSAFAKGDYVVARGEVQIRGPHGIVTMQPGWLYEFRAGRLVRFRGFPTQEAAMRAAGLTPQDSHSIVRELWDAAARHDTDRLMGLCADDVVWEPYTGRNAVYNGPEAVRDFYEEQYSEIETIGITEYGFRSFSDEFVLYSGSLHTVNRAGGIAQRQIHYLFWVRDGKIQRAKSFAQRLDATNAAEAAARAAPG